jgi:hypothetical protein
VLGIRTTCRTLAAPFLAHGGKGVIFSVLQREPDQQVSHQIDRLCDKFDSSSPKIPPQHYRRLYRLAERRVSGMRLAELAMAGGSTLLALPFESERNIGLF